MQKLIDALKAKAAQLEAEALADLSTPAGRASALAHVGAFLADVQPFIAGINTSAGIVVSTAITDLGKVAEVEKALGV